MRAGRGAGWVVKAGLLGLAALLGACSSDNAPLRACPQILIPVDGSQLTRFRPGTGRDIIDVLHEEKITGFSHRCVYDTDETGAGEMMVEVIPDIESARGPANAQSQSQFEYFVAITSPDKNVLEKQRFPITIEYPQNMSRVTWRRDAPIVMQIPLKAGELGEDYTIFLGLQLTREELDYQRKNR